MRTWLRDNFLEDILATILIAAFIIAVGIILWVILIIMGVVHDPHEGEHCIEHHYVPISTGKTIMIIYVCDRYIKDN